MRTITVQQTREMGPAIITYDRAQGFIITVEGVEPVVCDTFLTLLGALDFAPTPEQEEGIWDLTKT